jgi:hypothetical protein
MFRFSIRELMLVTLVAGLIVGWWLDRSRLATRDATWERQFRYAMETMKDTHLDNWVFQTPNGLWAAGKQNPHRPNY